LNDYGKRWRGEPRRPPPLVSSPTRALSSTRPTATCCGDDPAISPPPSPSSPSPPSPTTLTLRCRHPLSPPPSLLPPSPLHRQQQQQQQHGRRLATPRGTTTHSTRREHASSPPCFDTPHPRSDKDKDVSHSIVLAHRFRTRTGDTATEGT
ncbi:hypothetical protein F5148DRAFT_1207513, partial [Russula earlei]